MAWRLGVGASVREPHFALEKPPHPTGGALGGLLQGKIGVGWGWFLAVLVGFGLHGLKIRAEILTMEKQCDVKKKTNLPDAFITMGEFRVTWLRAMKQIVVGFVNWERQRIRRVGFGGFNASKIGPRDHNMTTILGEAV